MGYEEYTITREIRSETKVGLGIYAFDFFFLIIYAMVTFILRYMVHEALYVPFLIFSLLMAIFLTLPSAYNRKRRHYQSIIILLKKDYCVFRPVKNVSKMPPSYIRKKEKDDDKEVMDG